MRPWYFVVAAFAATPAAGAPRFGLPIACDIGKTCWVQQYFDHDATAAAADYNCGRETYDGHDGTDIRIRDTSQHADVVASAAGTVAAVRDGVADHLVRTDADRAAIKDIECGNGVLIDHGGGWQTQYCHLRKASLAVRKGQQVSAGDRLGQAGFSGMAGFPHVHLTVRENGKAVDPFRNGPQATASCGGMDNPLWTDEAQTSLSYHQGDLIGFGFAPGPVEMPQLEDGTAFSLEPARDWPALVAFGWAVNLREGDRMTASLQGPGGIAASNTAGLDRSKAQYMLFAGTRKPRGGWPKGTYVGKVTIGAGDAPRLFKEWRFTLR